MKYMREESLVLITKVFARDEDNEFEKFWIAPGNEGSFCLLLDDKGNIIWKYKDDDDVPLIGNMMAIVLDGTYLECGIKGSKGVESVFQFINNLFANDLPRSGSILVAIHYGDNDKYEIKKLLESNIKNLSKFFDNTIDYNEGQCEEIKYFRNAIKDNCCQGKILNSLDKLKNWLEVEIEKKDFDSVLNHFLPLYLDMQTLLDLMVKNNETDYIKSFLEEVSENTKDIKKNIAWLQSKIVGHGLKFIGEWKELSSFDAHSRETIGKRLNELFGIDDNNEKKIIKELEKLFGINNDQVKENIVTLINFLGVYECRLENTGSANSDKVSEGILKYIVEKAENYLNWYSTLSEFPLKLN